MMKRFGPTLLLCLYLAACSTTTESPPVATAKPPANKFENIHTLMQHVYVDYGNHRKTGHRTTISQTPFGQSSNQSIKVGRPLKSGIQLDVLTALQERNRSIGNQYSDISKARQTEDLRATANAVKKAPYEGVLQPIPGASVDAYKAADELDQAQLEIEEFCRDHRDGSLVRILLNGSKGDPEVTQPLPVSSVSKGSQIRLMCISGDEKPYQLPFIVDLNHRFQPNRRLEVHYTATVLDEPIAQKMLMQLEELTAAP